jgi:hypothetical protein
MDLSRFSLGESIMAPYSFLEAWNIKRQKIKSNIGRGVGIYSRNRDELGFYDVRLNENLRNSQFYLCGKKYAASSGSGGWHPAAAGRRWRIRGGYHKKFVLKGNSDCNRPRPTAVDCGRKKYTL